MARRSKERGEILEVSKSLFRWPLQRVHERIQEPAFFSVHDEAVNSLDWTFHQFRPHPIFPRNRALPLPRSFGSHVFTGFWPYLEVQWNLLPQPSNVSSKLIGGRKCRNISIVEQALNIKPQRPFDRDQQCARGERLFAISTIHFCSILFPLDVAAFTNFPTKVPIKWDLT